LKFGCYFPYNAKLCLNGNEYAKRPAAKAGIAFEALDNAFASAGDADAVQRICDGMGTCAIDGLARKWLARLPHPFSPADRAAGYRYDISVLQAEFSLTQMLDRPDHGFIRRIPHSHRYRVTGVARAMFLARAHDRLLTTGLAELTAPAMEPHPARLPRIPGSHRRPGRPSGPAPCCITQLKITKSDPIFRLRRIKPG
jgi:hypothetical protein